MNHVPVPSPAPGAPAPPHDTFALSALQQSVWLSEQMAPGTTAFNLVEAWRLSGPLDVASLEQAAQACVRRHETLRTSFDVVAGCPVQSLWPAQAVLPKFQELAGKENDLADWLAAEARRPFELKRPPLMRLKLFRLGERQHVLLLSLHHLIADEWSMRLLREELAAGYQAGVNGKAPSLPDLPIQYADYAIWQREMVGSGQFEQQLAYWQARLASPLPEVVLPADRVRPAVPSLRGATELFYWDQELVGALQALSRREGATLFMTLLAAFQILLHRYTRQPEITVGTPLAGRQRVETEGLVGFFANIHCLRTELKGNPTFREVLARVREAVLGAYANQDVTLGDVLERMQPRRDSSRHPVFQVVLALQPGLDERWELPGLQAERLELDNGGAKFDWSLLLTQTSQGLRVRSEYSTDLFKPGTVAQWVRQYETLLRSVLANPGSRISGLELLTEGERQQVLHDLSPAVSAEIQSTHTCLHEWFEGQAAQQPQATAASCEQECLSYGELNARANRWARYLQKLGVGPEKPVALLLERSLDTVVGILAVLKAGGCYVPLDPNAPVERLRFMLQDTRAQWVLTQSRLAPGWASGLAQIIALDADISSAAQESSENVQSGVTPENVAYVIYTSGSTGTPKGVEVTHRNVVRLFEQTQSWFGFNVADVWTLFHSYTFDFSVWEMWGALLHGGRLVVVPYLVSRSPGDFLGLLAAERVTVLNQTPSAFRQLLWAEGTSRLECRLSLRYVIFGGEALELQSLRPWFERHGDERPRLVNMYGITETTVHVTYRVIRQADLERQLGSVIGAPIPDLRLYLLDEYLQPVPQGIIGEICVGGAGLARGYLNQPELTSQRFVPDPFSRQSQARLYRSGDLARLTATGEVEYLGRMDGQVKLRGFRIELGEIEAALNRHPGVRESVVRLETRAVGDARLVAAVVGRGGKPAAEELWTFLHQHLPEYMVPSRFNVLEQLPLTSNGKVDRAALAAMNASAEPGQGVAEVPRNELEKTVADVWCQVLGRKNIGLQENFFQCGGHSLLATQAIGRLAAALGLELSVRLLFETPTIAGLASAIARLREQHSSGRATIPRRQQAAETQDLLDRLEQLTAEEIEQLLAEPGVGTISA